MGRVARVSGRLTWRDHLGTIGARTGFARETYLVNPGLYCLGKPDQDAPVLVTGNYKLTFDTVRASLAGQNLWLLVVDTRGINVWCAAGKGTFSTEEVAFQVVRSRLAEVVSHRRLILPQLSANGVAARKLKPLCGFTAHFGPIEARDIAAFLQCGTVSEEMRSISFTLAERAVLIPVEVCALRRSLLVILACFFIFSGISPELFSISAAIDRGKDLLLASLVAIAAGAVATPLLLPWLPFRQFWLKGALLGALAATLFVTFNHGMGGGDLLALFLWIVGLSSYLAMNFTGCTPFTSLSGVEKELRRGLPFQITTATLAMVIWLIAPFTALDDRLLLFLLN